MHEKTILRCQIESGDFMKGGEASSRLKDILRKLGIPAELNRRATIVMYELEMNIVIHSYGGEMTVSISSEKVKITARDQGPGIEDLERAFQPGYSTADDNVRDMGFGAGMGLNNVKHYSDDLRVRTGKGKQTCIVAHVFL